MSSLPTLPREHARIFNLKSIGSLSSHSESSAASEEHAGFRSSGSGSNSLNHSGPFACYHHRSREHERERERERAISNFPLSTPLVLSQHLCQCNVLYEPLGASQKWIDPLPGLREDSSEMEYDGGDSQACGSELEEDEWEDWDEEECSDRMPAIPLRRKPRTFDLKARQHFLDTSSAQPSRVSSMKLAHSRHINSPSVQPSPRFRPIQAGREHGVRITDFGWVHRLDKMHEDDVGFDETFYLAYGRRRQRHKLGGRYVRFASKWEVIVSGDCEVGVGEEEEESSLLSFSLSSTSEEREEVDVVQLDAWRYGG